MKVLLTRWVIRPSLYFRAKHCPGQGPEKGEKGTRDQGQDQKNEECLDQEKEREEPQMFKLQDLSLERELIILDCHGQRNIINLVTMTQELARGQENAEDTNKITYYSLYYRSKYMYISIIIKNKCKNKM